MSLSPSSPSKRRELHVTTDSQILNPKHEARGDWGKGSAVGQMRRPKGLMGLTELDKNTNGPLSHHGKLNFCSYLYLRQSASFGRFEEFGTFTFRGLTADGSTVFALR